MKCIFKNFIRCESTQVNDGMTVLVNAVNKLYEATGQPEREIVFDPSSDSITDPLSESARAIRIMAKKVDALRVEKVAYETEYPALEKEIQQLKEKKEAWTAEKKQLEAQVADYKKDAQAQLEENIQLKGKRKTLVESLIKFRDQLMLFKDNAIEEQDENTAKLLQSLYGETKRFMQSNAIEILDGGGAFDTTIHVSTGAVKTKEQPLDQTIESTFRDGYKVDGELLRPQEVMVYVYENEEADSNQ